MNYKKIEIEHITDLINLWKILMKEHEKLEPELYSLSETAKEKQIEFFSNCINSKNKFLYGAFDKNKLVGSIFGWIDERPPVLKINKNGNLSDMIVNPKYRGKGIGKELLNQFILWCKKQDINNIQLHVLFNKESIEFYKKQGFRDYMRQMVLTTK